MQFFFNRVENIVGKGENAGYQHFLLFPQSFSNDFLPRLLKSALCGKGLSFNYLWQWKTIFLNFSCQDTTFTSISVMMCEREAWCICNVYMYQPRSLHSPCTGGSLVIMSDSWLGGCEFETWLRWTFFLAYFRLSPLLKPVRKVVGGNVKKVELVLCEKARKHMCITDHHDNYDLSC